MMDEPLKVFIAEHDGVYLNGVTIIAARTLADAEILAAEAVGASVGKASNMTVREFNALEPCAEVVWNGDY